MFAYIVSGLRVSSDLALPGLIDWVGRADACDPDFPSREADADVVIRLGAVPLALDNATASGPNWQIAEGRFLIAMPGIIRLLLTAGDTIVYALDGDTAIEDAAVFVSGTGFGILLHQRGRLVLHASAVRAGDNAVLFCGASGAGKSTLAAALVAAGHELLADDFCGISIAAGGVPFVYPDGRQLKLWENAIARLSLDDRRRAPVRARLRKYYVEPHAAIAEALPIAAVYMLREARPPHVPGIAPANLVDGALMIQRNAYRPAMIARMGQAALYFQGATAIARHAGVFTLTREMDFAGLAAVVEGLETHWRHLANRSDPAAADPSPGDLRPVAAELAL